MADKFANNRNRVAIAARAGGMVVNSHVWDAEISANGDKIYIGDLPAGHKLCPEASSLIFDGATGAMTLDVCVDVDGNPIFDNAATLATTFTRVACTTYQLAHTLGVSPLNRAIYLLLGTAVTVTGGKVVANIASYAAP
jgi:hypothetical protein